MAIILLLFVNKMLWKGREAKVETRNEEYSLFLWGCGRFYFYFQLSTLWSCKRILWPACCHLIYRAFPWEWYSSHLTDITLETHMTGSGQWNLSRSSVGQWRDYYDQVEVDLSGEIPKWRKHTLKNHSWPMKYMYYEWGIAFCCYKPLSFSGFTTASPNNIWLLHRHLNGMWRQHINKCIASYSVFL